MSGLPGYPKAPIAPESSSPWLDPDRSAVDRANLLLETMTFDQKVALARSEFDAVADLGIPALVYTDGPNGVRDADDVTAFPSAQALAAAFDEGLAAEFGAAVAAEARCNNRNVWLGPALDIARAPLGGRLGEALGEDPLLTGRMAAAEVAAARRGHVATMLKHFIVNNHEDGRTGMQRPAGRGPATNVVVSDRALREVYLPPFQAALRAGAGSLMGSYNRVNGEYACQNREILDIPKEEWRWRGCIAPDFALAVRDPLAAANAGLDVPGLDGAAGRTVEHFTSGQISAERLDDIAGRILWTMFDGGLFDHPLPERSSPARTAAHLDLATRIATGGMVLLANPRGVLPLGVGIRSIAVIGTARDDAQYIMGGSAAVTLNMSEVSTPLRAIASRAGAATRTEFAQGTPGDVILPTVPSDVWSGRASGGIQAAYWAGAERSGQPVLRRPEPTLDVPSTPDGLPGVWSARWTGTLVPRVSGLHRFSLAFSGDAQLFIDDIEIATGYREAVRFFGPDHPLNAVAMLQAGHPVRMRVEYETAAAIAFPEMGFVGPAIQLGWLEPSSRLEEAAALAGRSDIAIVVVSHSTGEGMDRRSMALPGDQDALICKIAAANPSTIVVLNTAGPVSMPWLPDVAGVVQAWYAGERFGAALAAVLFGDADPGGRLPMTFPAAEDQGPVTRPDQFPGVDATATYEEGVFVGYRWFDAHAREPLFPFGHGLSYAEFRYDALRVDTTPDGATATVALTNVGDRTGSEVVQLYVGPPPDPMRPPRRLADFAKVSLQPGEQAEMVLRVPQEAVTQFDEATHAWATVVGRYELRVGRSSRDLRLRGAFGVRIVDGQPEFMSDASAS